MASAKYLADFVPALLQEMDREKNFLKEEPVTTIYLGGGTPSMLPPDTIRLILDSIMISFSVDDDPEITLEANPDDLDPVYLQEILIAGVTRLSIGIQSFFDEDLKILNRTHTAATAERSVADARKAGFDNLSIDLIYGIPGLTADRWEANIEKAISLGVPHISAYALTVEEHTALDILIRKNKAPAPDEEEAVVHYRILMERMRQAGFVHYEISNFCQEGYLSRHNSNYWKGVPYLGLGPSAHSFNGHTRRWNVSSLSQYFEAIRQGKSLWESEELTPEKRYNEYVMTSLRTIWGCSKQKIVADWGLQTADFFSQEARNFISRGLMNEISGIYYLTDEGKLFADGIASALFLVEP
jgi:oxygen-independent coproporphyrinogen-3 oxidase